MNNPFDYTPDAACDAAFKELMSRVEALKKSDRPEDINFCRELDEGKMLGVLIAVDASGERHTLYAFSGQIGDGGFHYPGFVGPVFDYLQPDGYFKTNEAEITHQNAEIARFKESHLLQIEQDYERKEVVLNAEIAAYKDKCRLSKMERDSRRGAGELDDAELAAMVRQSQFEKAELHRLKKRVAADLEPYANRLKEARAHLVAMKEKRRADSEALQGWLFRNFTVLNAHGERKSLSDIFSETPLKIPPSGAGECCAPKLLQAAYLNGWQPIAIAEYWYGKPKGGEVRIHGNYYPACRGKCLPVLGWMLQGLDVESPLENDNYSEPVDEPEIIYENQWFCVVNKPAGMLSVPGKGKSPSVQQWLDSKYGAEKGVKMAHRLDQDTSGLLIATFGDYPFKVMQRIFATRKVKKYYVADLEGNYKSLGVSRHGCIELPLSPDLLDRPRQLVDFDCGKESVTEYEFLGVKEGMSRIKFYPHTGRTHQLRVHAASASGLGMPIVGDRLYGSNMCIHSGRLHLHARRLEFTFPLDDQHYSFELPVPF